jgi:hypothetical protein
MNETALKTKIMKMLRDEYPNIWCYKVNDRFTSGIPDILGCLQGGHLFALELKVLPNKATKLQDHVIRKIQAAGGKAGVAYNMDDVRNILKGGDISARKD